MYNTKAIGHLFTQYVTQVAHANTGIPRSNTLLFNSSECALIGNVRPKRNMIGLSFNMATTMTPCDASS